MKKGKGKQVNYQPQNLEQIVQIFFFSDQPHTKINK